MSNFPRSAHTFNYPRYLKALEPVSARAQSDTLYQQFLEGLALRAGATDTPLHVLEIGAGRGDQMRRILDDAAARGIKLDYTALEPASANRSVAESEAKAYQAGPHTVTIAPDSFLAFATKQALPYDAVVARSVLDLMPLREALTAIGKSLSEHGMLYAPLTFALGTSLSPHPGDRSASTESKIKSVYHQSIYQKTNLKKGSYPAQEIVHWANEKGARVDVRGSDWVIAPSKKKYRNDESYVLQSVLAFMHDEAEQADAVPHSDLDAWWTTRMRMLHNNTLIYTANQFDLLIWFD